MPPRDVAGPLTAMDGCQSLSWRACEALEVREQEQELEAASISELASLQLVKSNQVSVYPGMFQTIEFGRPGTLQYRMLFGNSSQGTLVSPLHDIPLHVENSELLNFVCLTPQGCWAEFETVGNEPFNPIKLKNWCNSPAHFSRDCPFGWSFGFLPQTWGTGEGLDIRQGLRGGQRGVEPGVEPLEAVVLGSQQAATGEVYPVRLLGAFGLLRASGDLAWTALAVAANDEKLSAVTSLQELQTSDLFSGGVIQDWLSKRHCDGADGPVNNRSVSSGQQVGKDWAQQVVAEGHASWQFLVSQRDPRLTWRLPLGTDLKSQVEYESAWAQFSTPSAGNACIPLSNPVKTSSVDLDKAWADSSLLDKWEAEANQSPLAEHPRSASQEKLGQRKGEKSRDLTLPRNSTRLAKFFRLVSGTFRSGKESSLKFKVSDAEETPGGSPRPSLLRSRSFDLDTWKGEALREDGASAALERRSVTLPQLASGPEAPRCDADADGAAACASPSSTGNDSESDSEASASQGHVAHPLGAEADPSTGPDEEEGDPVSVVSQAQPSPPPMSSRQSEPGDRPTPPEAELPSSPQPSSPSCSLSSRSPIGGQPSGRSCASGNLPPLPRSPPALRLDPLPPPVVALPATGCGDPSEPTLDEDLYPTAGPLELILKNLSGGDNLGASSGSSGGGLSRSAFGSVSMRHTEGTDLDTANGTAEGDLYPALTSAGEPFPGGAPQGSLSPPRARSSEGKEKRVQFAPEGVSSPLPARHRPSSALPRKSSFKRTSSWSGTMTGPPDVTIGMQPLQGDRAVQEPGAADRGPPLQKPQAKPLKVLVPADHRADDVEPPLALPVNLGDEDCVDSSCSNAISPVSILDFKRSTSEGHGTASGPLISRPIFLSPRLGLASSSGPLAPEVDVWQGHRRTPGAAQARVRSANGATVVRARSLQDRLQEQRLARERSARWSAESQAGRA